MGCAISCNTSSPPDSPFRSYVTPRLVTQLVELASPVEQLQPSVSATTDEDEEDRDVDRVRTFQSLLERGQRAGSGARCTLHVPHQTSTDSEVTVYSEWSVCTMAGNEWNTGDDDDDDLRASSLTRQEMAGKVLLY
ncbi:PREDICTED: uncharacterized protein LOC109477792 isoform X2 [Branchiostoma belcheri]|uniref:Uncharacterized protein LOC109477792 isoform X2 n=1 Tax=Branchiostoma belcheri TaxID=7741 RepID=A0A6P4ZUX3_BRABE|nr:PREDICTED: uncharacterized protein LOC109477792 isoform X2 [Branchiostoma belcheri]